MRRIWRALLLLAVSCGLSASLSAQGGFTTVTGTITGAIDGLVWSCGTISAQLITAGGASPTLNGGGFSTSTSPIGLGCPSNGQPAGSFSMRLADSGVIVPGTTTWQFTVNMAPGIAPPAGTGPQSFTYTTAINCSTNTPSTCTANTMSISVQLSALAPKLSNASAGGSPAFGAITSGTNSSATMTVGTGASLGTSGSGAIAATTVPYSGVAAGTSTAALAEGNGGSIAVTPGTSGSIAGVQTASPPIANYLTNQCPTSNTPTCTYTPANVIQYVGVSWNSGSPTITCLTLCNFTAAINGFNAMGWNTCNAFQNNLSSNAASGALINSGGAAQTVTFVNSTTLTLSANAANSTSVVSGTGGCLVLFQPDDTGAAAFSTVIANATNCPMAILAAAGYVFTTPPGFMVNQPNGCNINGGTYGGSLGNLFYSYGYVLQGRDVGPTQIWIPPWFSGCTNGPSANACFVQVIESLWEHLSFTGGQNSQGISNVVLLREVGPNTLNYVTFLNWGAGNSTTFCSANSAWATWYQVNNSGCGAVGHDILNNFSGGASWSGFRVSIENSPSAALQTEAADNSPPVYTAYCLDCHLFNAQLPGGNNNIIRNAGSTIALTRTDISIANNATAMNAYQTTASGSKLILKQVDFRNTNINTGSGSLFCATACTVVMEDTTLAAGATGHTYFDTSASSKLIDQGNNVFGTAAQLGISGSVYLGLSATGTQQVTTNIALSGLGTGLTAPSSASGDSLSETFTFTLGTAPGANGTAAVTFPTAFPTANGLNCSAQQTGGSAASVLPLTTSTPTATGVTITYFGTFVSGTVITRLTCGY
jgi:hypothetical protein